MVFSLRRGLVVALLLSVALAAFSQQPPRVGYVYPAGGRQGTTFQVTVGGQFLEGASAARVSSEGVEASVLEYIKPLSPGQASELRSKLQELMKKQQDARTAGLSRRSAATRPAWTPQDARQLEDIRARLARFVRRPSSPAIAETVTLQVTIAANAEPGQRELRLLTPLAITNPLVFWVGQLPEFREQESNNPADWQAPEGSRPRDNMLQSAAAAQSEMTVTLPAVVNGQIMPGDVDRWRFTARKGQRLVVAASARSLVPYLPDAVPGWFQATLSLHDSKGKELAYEDDYRFHPDPALVYKVPADGEYFVEIHDSVYRGREDFVYRIGLGELPFVTGVYPLGGPAGANTTVEVRGWNLPLASHSQVVKAAQPGILELTARRGNLLSNAVPFAVDDLPECMEKEANDLRSGGQAVTLPVIVNGRIAPAGDSDVFRVEGIAGQKIVMEVRARRLESPLDSVLRLADAAGRQLAFNDDHEDKGAGLSTHHADSYLHVKLPATGTYYIHLSDAQGKGGPEYNYRLRISPPRPDFELRVVPSAINVRAGGTAALSVYALRKDGFAGEIELSLSDAPPGVSLSGGRVPPGADQVKLTLTAPRPTEPLSLSLQGRATIQGREVTRTAVPAEDMMQAFAYRHLVPARELLAKVSGRWIQRNAVKILSDTPVMLPAGGIARVRLGFPTRPLQGKIELELSEPPDGISIQRVLPSDAGAEIVLRCDARAKPGLKGNLIVSAFAARPGRPGNAKSPARTAVGVLPAIPFEVVARK